MASACQDVLRQARFIVQARGFFALCEIRRGARFDNENPKASGA
jgi:hypothetical protein